MIILFGSVFLVSGCGGGGGDTPTPAFSISSTSYLNGDTIPLKCAHNSSGGRNLSPQLSFANPPAGTQYYAIKMIDQQSQTWVHWLAINIPVSTTSLSEDASGAGSLPTESFETNNYFTSGTTFGYGGPAPPIGGGTHTYVITVYALNSQVTLGVNATNTQFDTAVAGYLDSATWSGTYSR